MVRCAAEGPDPFSEATAGPTGRKGLRALMTGGPGLWPVSPPLWPCQWAAPLDRWYTNVEFFGPDRAERSGQAGSEWHHRYFRSPDPVVAVDLGRDLVETLMCAVGIAGESGGFCPG